ncbi:MAG: DNA alkylation repair protein [Candidatus Hodarchaeales archaeon]
MRLKVSKKNREKYEIENTKIFTIKEEIETSNTKKARELLEHAFNQTGYKTKFNEPEKELSKYYALKLLEKPVINGDLLHQFIKDLWEKKDASLREMGTFLLSRLYTIDSKKYFIFVIELASLCNTWNDIDNLVMYVLEEHVARDYENYCEKLGPLITHENQWVKRLVIVSLGRGFFISKNKLYVKKCLEVIDQSFTDSRKIVLDANSWVIGTLGLRVNPEEVIRYFQKYRSSDEPVIIKLFCDAVKRSKLVKKLPVALKEEIITSLETWGGLDLPKTKKSVVSALKFIQTG